MPAYNVMKSHGLIAQYIVQPNPNPHTISRFNILATRRKGVSLLRYYEEITSQL